jgi:hypothetical protein
MAGGVARVPHSAARRHDAGDGPLALAEAVAKPSEIARDTRTRIRLDDRRRRPLEFANLGKHVAGQHDIERGCVRRECAREQPLVLIISVRMEQSDGHDLRTAANHALDNGPRRAFIQ